MTDRRDFLARLGLLATAALAADAVDPAELRAAASSSSPSAHAAWDTSWLDVLATAKYKAVFNVSEVQDGVVLTYATFFLDGFHAAHDTSDADTRPVAVFRHRGTPMAFNDAIWDRYGVGDELKADDAETHARARRNIYWRAAASASADESKTTLQALQARGLISLVCNVATEGWATRTAERMKKKRDEVIADVKANLIPGAILVPSGIYGLIRAQNAGCAYMPGA